MGPGKKDIEENHENRDPSGICRSDNLEDLSCFTLSALRGFDRTIGVSRLDASRILFTDGKYHLWYTRFENRNSLDEIWAVPNHTTIWLAVSEDGWNWTEIGDVMAHGGTGFWPACGRHAPYVVPEFGRYFMFFTAYIGAQYLDKRIGIAVADRPEGPFTYLGDGPLLPAVSDIDVFDSVGQDDACVIRRDGHYLCYFKGYTFNKEENKVVNNQICLATADNLAGPYERFRNNPVAQSHTGCVWPHRTGVALISDAAPLSIHYSDDGERFSRSIVLSVTIDDPSLLKAVEASKKYWYGEICDPGLYWDENGMSWGIAQMPDIENAPDGGLPPPWYPFFARFDVKSGKA
jgi:hypothetical protein